MKNILVLYIMQSSALGNLSSVSYFANTGFWYTLLLTVGIGDVNEDGSVDLEDVITALQVVTGQSPDRIFLKPTRMEMGA